VARKLLDEVPLAMTRHRCVRLTGQAVVAEAEGHLGHAADQYAEAAERWRDYGHMPEQALGLLGQGRCLLTLGRAGARGRSRRRATCSRGWATNRL
jgi:hypothetical protein